MQYDVTLFAILSDIGTWYACIIAQNHNMPMQLCRAHPTLPQLWHNKDSKSLGLYSCCISAVALLELCCLLAPLFKV